MPFDTTPLYCLSHLRWDFVWQRPQQLMSRFAADRRVVFVEEPIFDAREPWLERRHDFVEVLIPHLPSSFSPEAADAQVAAWLREAVALEAQPPILWLYTPLALGWTEGVPCALMIYDCMDELSGFRGAPTAMQQRELELFEQADIVFTGGPALQQSKAKLHSNVHCFPSSVDQEHFSQARRTLPVPSDQAEIGRPILGYFGVIDERIDHRLLEEVARLEPSWQIVLVGPIVKVGPEELAQGPNLHYLGMKQYAELPAYLAGWDVALLPFALNEATRFISPTKTPEYLAGGVPAVSTPIRDVVHPYGDAGLVEIAHDAREFVERVQSILDRSSAEHAEWLAQVDDKLAGNSWNLTVRSMNLALRLAATRRLGTTVPNTREAVTACTTI